MSQSNNIVKCPGCSYMMEAAQGQVDYNAKDDNGNAMSPAAAIHMSRYRIRCRQCEQNFCHGCNTIPYHAGKNCEEYAFMQNARKCRFCGDVLANQEEVKGAAAGNFDDVCLKAECQDMVRENCDKILPCGHPCRGFFGERECLPCLKPECV